MIDRLINNFLKFGSLSQLEKEAIIQDAEITELMKSDFLLKEGEKSFNSYFVLKGCIRQFNLSNGEEKTTRFFTENEWVISVDETSENAISIHNWVCMEDCILVIGNEEKAQVLFEKFPRLETIEESLKQHFQKFKVFYLIIQKHPNSDISL